MSDGARAMERQRIAAIVRRKVRQMQVELADIGGPEDDVGATALAATEATALTIARWIERGAQPGGLEL